MFFVFRRTVRYSKESEDYKKEVEEAVGKAWSLGVSYSVMLPQIKAKLEELGLADPGTLLALADSSAAGEGAGGAEGVTPQTDRQKTGPRALGPKQGSGNKRTAPAASASSAPKVAKTGKAKAADKGKAKSVPAPKKGAKVK